MPGVAPAGIAAVLAAAVAAVAAASRRSRRPMEAPQGRCAGPSEDRQGLQESRRWDGRDHAQEASRLGKAGFQDWRQAHGRRQAQPDWPPNRGCGGPDRHHGQGGKHGKGKGPSQGRGKGRRGQGSKGKHAQKARRKFPRTEEQHRNVARRKGRTAKRFGQAAAAIHDELRDEKRPGRTKEVRGKDGGQPDKEGTESGAKTWFK